MTLRATALAILALIALALPAAGKTLRWAATSDASTLDPQSEAELFTNLVTGLQYEALVRFDNQLHLVPSLATSWKSTGPRTWVFTLRQGVKFEDGTPLTADDVVFSFERARSPTSSFRVYANQAGTLRALDDHTIEFTTPVPNPVLPISTVNIFIMSRKWCVEHHVERPLDYVHHEESYASRHAMGTGPYTLVENQPGVLTVHRANAGWWGIREGLFTGNVDRIELHPIANPSTRMAALKSGELDFVLDPPVQDVARLQADPTLHVWLGNENRVIMIGLDMARNELLYSDVKGRNPFKDRRVRLALDEAIDIEAIRTQVMRGMSMPAAIPFPSLVDLPEAKEQRPPYDPAAARRLLAEAGYPDGFGFTLHCPNDRYVNDEKICVALAAMWARVGLRVRVETLPKTLYFQKAQQLDVTAFMVGWGGAVTDPIFALKPLLHSRTKDGAGDNNLGDFRIPELDALTDAIAVEMDPARRKAMLLETITILERELPVLTLHRQVIPWVSRAGIELVHRANNTPLFFTVKMP